MGDGPLDADVVVVGGGPAGGAAAIACAARGLRVVLLQRDAAELDRPGETLHPGVEPLLAQLGVADRLAEVTGARPAGIWIEWGGPRRFEPYGEDADGPWRGFQVSRAAFDTLLLERARELYDLTRVDHFRAFAGYWSIPGGAETAMDGSWVSGPGKELFDAVYGRIGEVAIIAEDLGVITPDVTEVRFFFFFFFFASLGEKGRRVSDGKKKNSHFHPPLRPVFSLSLTVEIRFFSHLCQFSNS